MIPTTLKYSYLLPVSDSRKWGPIKCTLPRRYILLYFLQKKEILLLPRKYEIKGFVIHQNDTNIHLSVPTSLHYPTMNLYILLADFVLFCRLMEWALKGFH